MRSKQLFLLLFRNQDTQTTPYESVTFVTDAVIFVMFLYHASPSCTPQAAAAIAMVSLEAEVKEQA